MNCLKRITLIACLACPVCFSFPHFSSLAFAESAATDTKAEKPNKAALEAMLSKCSEEADAKRLFVRSGKGAERKAFRRECMRKMGVEPH